MITLLCGINGAGNSSYAAYLALQAMINGRNDLKACKCEFDMLNKNGFNYNLPQQRHLVYSDNTVFLGKKYKTHVVDGFKIGLSNLFLETNSSLS